MKIRITLPFILTDSSPEWVNQAWVGLEVDACGPEGEHHFRVKSEVLFKALKTKEPEAYEWWFQFFSVAMTRGLIFTIYGHEAIAESEE